MRTTYKVLAYAIAVLIVVQAAAIAFALAGLGTWVQDGGVLDKAVMENEEDVPGFVVGFIVHGMNGQLLIPLLVLVLLVVSFFAKIDKGVPFAAAVFGEECTSAACRVDGMGLSCAYHVSQQRPVGAGRGSC